MPANNMKYVKEVIYHIQYGTATFAIVVQAGTKEIVAYAPIASKTVRMQGKDYIKVLRYYAQRGATIQARYFEGYIQ